MKIVKFCLLPLFVLLGLVYGYGYFVSPDGWDVEVSREIEATPAEIHPWIADLSRWPDWLADQGVEYTYTFEGPASGVGAIATSNDGRHEIRWEITASDPQKGVWFDELLGGQSDAKGAILLEATSGGTKVSWVDRGSLGRDPIKRIFHPLMQNQLAAAFQENLTSLERMVEAAKAAPEADEEPAAK